MLNFEKKEARLKSAKERSSQKTEKSSSLQTGQQVEKDEGSNHQHVVGPQDNLSDREEDVVRKKGSVYLKKGKQRLKVSISKHRENFVKI